MTTITRRAYTCDDLRTQIADLTSYRWYADATMPDRYRVVCLKPYWYRVYDHAYTPPVPHDIGSRRNELTGLGRKALDAQDDLATRLEGRGVR